MIQPFIYALILILSAYAATGDAQDSTYPNWIQSLFTKGSDVSQKDK